MERSDTREAWWSEATLGTSWNEVILAKRGGLENKTMFGWMKRKSEYRELNERIEALVMSFIENTEAHYKIVAALQIRIVNIEAKLSDYVDYQVVHMDRVLEASVGTENKS